MPSSSKSREVDDEDQRRQQNRQAQREFRLRKQREKEELKARIEFLERDPGQQSQLMTRVARELYAENNRLRALVQSLSSFIGNGAGSSLQTLGLTQAQIDNLSNYSQVENEVDLGFEMFMQNKAKEGAGNALANAGNAVSQQNKRPRYSLSNQSHSSSASPSNSAAVLAPPSASTSVAPPDNSQSQPQSQSYALQTLLNDNLSSGAKSTSTSSPQIQHQQQQQNQQPPPANFQNECLSMMSTNDNDFNMSTKINGEETTLYNFASSLKHYSSSKMVQAAQLIEYNLNNFRADQSYHLPPSLKPTLTQRTVPHDSLIDGVPFASVRDKLILHNDKIDLKRVLRMLLTSTTIHGEDVLNSENWEIDERFYNDYAFLIDKDMLAASNKWRERSGRPLLMTPTQGEMNELEP
ncbi:hypothetical protein E3P99_00570 [Wallemia hederae]|uniref:BZIP domain-containing protein n=1 Tax=Wallemia hederae TaxID=1540922 RepID=A0A4T0FVD6_9BASI|nr:hypothetical protein E3P99_00570 [Wallemia hederae]